MGARGPRREPMERFSILTTTAARVFADIHHREPMHHREGDVRRVAGTGLVAAPGCCNSAQCSHWSGNQRQGDQDDE